MLFLVNDFCMGFYTRLRYEPFQIQYFYENSVNN